MHVFKTHFNSIFLLNLLDTHKYQDFDFFQRCHRKFNVRGYFLEIFVFHSIDKHEVYK